MFYFLLSKQDFVIFVNLSLPSGWQEVVVFRLGHFALASNLKKRGHQKAFIKSMKPVGTRVLAVL